MNGAWQSAGAGRDQPTICLCMIVKDEATAIASCVASCRDLIDHWVICDTGSTDGTQELIRRELAGIPGELHERPWVDFGHNRSELLALARGSADYLLLMDADWTIDASREQLANLTADAYTVRFGTGIDFYRHTLVRGGLDWHYVGRVHEYIHSDAAKTVERLEGVSVQTIGVGGEAKGRWEDDIGILEAALERDPDDARSAFYLAQTHRDLGNLTGDDEHLRRAERWYRRRAAMDGWIEEIYCAWHQAGAISERLGDWPAAADAYLHAWEARPERLEALHALAVGLRLRGLQRAAHRFTSLAAGLKPLPVPPDLLFVEPWIYRWGLLFEYSITAYWRGDYDAAIAACRSLLAIGELPEAHRRQTATNMDYAVRGKVRVAAAQPAAVRRIMLPGSHTRAFSGADGLTPVELRVPGLGRRLAALCGMSPMAADRKLLGLGQPIEVSVAALAAWPLRVRPGSSDVALIDTVCNGTAHLPPHELEEPTLIVDLGAQVGITALDLARRYPSAQIVAVEMDGASVTLCAENLSPLADRATVVGAAIAASDGSVAYSTTGDPGHHAIVEDGEGEAAAITLDTLFEHVAAGRIVDYVKMNIEGSEEAVLRAGGNWPASVRSITVVAHGSYGADGARDDLRALGFTVAGGDSGVAYGARTEPRPVRSGRRLRARAHR